MSDICTLIILLLLFCLKFHLSLFIGAACIYIKFSSNLFMIANGWSIRQTSRIKWKGYLYFGGKVQLLLTLWWIQTVFDEIKTAYLFVNSQLPILSVPNFSEIYAINTTRKLYHCSIAMLEVSAVTSNWQLKPSLQTLLNSEQFSWNSSMNMY